MDDTSKTLKPWVTFAGCVLARDLGEAADLIERHVKTEPRGSVYDALLLPALNYAERDRLEQRLANHVASTLAETRTQIGELIELPRIQVPGATGVHAA